jgi:hypothetical protein
MEACQDAKITTHPARMQPFERSLTRNRAVQALHHGTLEQWKMDSRYHRRLLAKTAFSRYKQRMADPGPVGKILAGGILRCSINSPAWVFANVLAVFIKYNRKLDFMLSRFRQTTTNLLNNTDYITQLNDLIRTCKLNQYLECFLHCYRVFQLHFSSAG